MNEELTWKHHTLRVEDVLSRTEIVLTVRAWTTIREIKQMIFEQIGTAPSTQLLCYKGREMINRQTIVDIGIEREDDKLQLIVTTRSLHSGFTIEPADSADESRVTSLISSVKRGLTERCNPIKTDEFEGSGGVYFFTAPYGKRLAVFKPQDEEQGMPLNPKYYKGDGSTPFKQYFKPGDNCLREVAAHILDVDGFASVPLTTLVHCEHEIFAYPGNPYPHYYPKFGSLQQYVVADDVFENLGIGNFSILDIQKIALFDLRILNCDRNSSNILVQKLNTSKGAQYQLIPIDHGFCLPTRPLVSAFDWCWYDTPQVQEPVCPEIVEYIQSIDIDVLISTLRSRLQLPEESLYLVKVMHTFIRRSVEMGLILKDIADLVAREYDDAPAAKLEMALDSATENAFRRLEHWSHEGQSLFAESTVKKSPSNYLKTARNLTLKDPSNSFVPVMMLSKSPRMLDNSSIVDPLAYDEEKRSPSWRSPTDESDHASQNSNHSSMNADADYANGSNIATKRSHNLEGSLLIRLSTVDHPSKPTKSSCRDPLKLAKANAVRISPHTISDPRRIRSSRREREEHRESEDDDSSSPPGFWNDSYWHMHEIVNKRASMLDFGTIDEDENEAEGEQAALRDVSPPPVGNDDIDDSYGYFDPLDDSSPLASHPNVDLRRPVFHKGLTESTDESEFSVATDIAALPTKSFPLMRVSTFSGFDSPMEYDTEKNLRRFPGLKKERRKQLEASKEFSDCRWLLLTDTLDAIITRVARTKHQNL